MSKDWRLDLDGRPTTDDQFVIRHYAGPIVYTVDDFLRKNKDTLYSHLVSLGSASENPLLQHLFQIVAPAASGDGAGTPRGGGRRGTSMQATVGDRFHKRLGELMKMIRETRPSFVRCIKSNTTFAASTGTTVDDGLNVYPALVGVIVYSPLMTVNEYAPAPSDVGGTLRGRAGSSTVARNGLRFDSARTSRSVVRRAVERGSAEDGVGSRRPTASFFWDASW